MQDLSKKITASGNGPGSNQDPVLRDPYSQYGSFAHSSIIFLGGLPPR